MNEVVRHAGRAIDFSFWRAMASLGLGGLLCSGYVTLRAFQYELGQWELSYAPVLASVTICNGAIDKSTGDCRGDLVTYEAFEQTEAHCEGRDAVVSGTMSKVRRAEYVPGRQSVYYGDPGGRFRRAFWQPLDQPHDAPTSRPEGVQDWGPWKLEGGCVTRYRTWFTIVEHNSWHGLWPLVTTSGPLPLPRADIQ